MAEQTMVEARNDGALVNALTGMGTARDKNTATQVGAIQFLTQPDLEGLYINSWLCRRIVELVPSEATREGWDIGLGSDETKKSRKQSDALVAAGEKLKLRRMVRKAAAWARLHGGAVLVMVIDDGRKADQPVNMRGIRRIRALHPIDRWRIWPAPGWSGVGEPELYQFITYGDADVKAAGLGSETTMEIHRDRLLRFEGDEAPHRLSSSLQWWGVSVLQAVMDVFTRYDIGMQAASQILHDFDTFIQKTPGLAGMIAAGNTEVLTKRLELNMMARSVYRGMLLDANEEAAYISRNASGVGDVLDRLRDEITGASKIPHTKLWGEAPGGGIGANGRSEDRNFAQDVSQWQEDHLEEPLKRFYELLMRSREGPYTGEPPEEWSIAFRPTFVLTDEESAALRQTMASADSTYIQSGVLKPNEVALGRFGRPEFSLETTLIDREPDGSIPMEEQQPIEFGGDAGAPVDGMEPPLMEEEAATGAEQQGAAPQGPEQQRPTRDSADEPCCESCGRGDPCESDCEGGTCEKEDGEGEDDPSTHKHPDKVGQVMHRWKHGVLHSGTGRKGEHRNALKYGEGSRKQALAIALSIAGKDRPPRRRRGRTRTVREDSGPLLPARLTVAGVTVQVGPDGTGPMIGPYGSPTPHQAVVGADPSGCWEVLDSTGEWFAVLGVEDQQALQAAAGDGCTIRRLDALDLAALGVRCDAYGEEG